MAILPILSCTSKEEKIAKAREKPADVVLKFYTALQKGDRKQARLYVTNKYLGTTAKVLPFIGNKVLEVIIITEELMSKNAEYKIISEEISGDKAVVQVERTFGPQKVVTNNSIYLYFEKDGWYIVRIGGEAPWISTAK
ncbi:MAG: DUF4878 domain-containing protein [Candidatus Sumerlaeia bacterium]|nr:DUF4878 domain-containing protein [Candidatus Sumerlaeia bacterium]